MNKDKVWLITGCSTGFGRSLAQATIKAGYKVAVTARKKEDITDLTEGKNEQCLALALDVTKQEDIEHAVSQTIATFGRIDVLVNNAGIGYFGAIEESNKEEVIKMFDINVFGLANMTRAVLPQMRKQKSGNILNVASIGGLVGFPAVGYYNATKFAVDGFSEALAKELEPLGIKVTIIAPSGFRTDWAGRSANEVDKQIADYESTAGANMKNIRKNSGNQAGDPERAALAMIKVVESDNPPLRLLLGSAALKNARIKLDTLKADFDTWAEVTESADFPESER